MTLGSLGIPKSANVSASSALQTHTQHPRRLITQAVNGAESGSRVVGSGRGAQPSYGVLAYKASPSLSRAVPSWDSLALSLSGLPSSQISLANTFIAQICVTVPRGEHREQSRPGILHEGEALQSLGECDRLVSLHNLCVRARLSQDCIPTNLLTLTASTGHILWKQLSFQIFSLSSSLCCVSFLQ